MRGRRRALDLLHESHPGIVWMKSLAREYMWRPGMDKEIELSVKQCPSTRTMPPTAPLHPWARPWKPWSRVDVDYAGPFKGKIFLLIQWRRQGGKRGKRLPLFFKENALGVEQSVTS